ncbi:MAG: sulfatase-like hydrolase/transferase [Chromatiales bacterium]|nr:sulfatase-like hydrolase/transferase [Chromatiales bacterium]
MSCSSWPTSCAGTTLGCSGHPYLKTPNIDALARRGLRFDNAFVNSGVCGPSRMSFYTGRYPITHGATWNRVPLSVGEVTLGEMLRGAGRLAGAGRQDARDAGP